MRRRAFAAALAALASAGTALASGPGAPSASAPPAASASAPVAPSASASAPAPAPSARALPPGHPPAGRGPAGHPQARGEFEAPEDGTIDDPSLPVGTLIATIRDAERKPLAGVDLVLHVLESSVTKGDSAQQRRGRTNEQGEVRFDGLSVSSAMQYKVSVTRGAATFETDPRPLGKEAGARAILHVYESSASIDDVMVAMFAGVSVTLREDALQVDEVLQILNGSAVAWLPAVEIPLPPGAKAFTTQDTGSLVVAKEKDGVVRITGTVGPGRSGVAFRFQIPLEDDGAQTVDLKLPPRVGAARVIAEVGGEVSLEVPSFPPAQPEPTRDGRKVLLTERRITQPELGLGGIPTLTLRLSGLPKKPMGPYLAVALAVVTAGGGLWLALQRRRSGAPTDALEDLVEAREVLARELEALERAKEAGDVGPKTYESARGAILDALARVLERIEALEPERRPRASREPQRPKKRRKREGAAEA